MIGMAMCVQAVGKALREREQALLTVQALEAELRRKRKGIGSLEQEGSQVGSISAGWSCDAAKTRLSEFQWLRLCCLGSGQAFAAPICLQLHILLAVSKSRPCLLFFLGFSRCVRLTKFELKLIGFQFCRNTLRRSLHVKKKREELNHTFQVVQHAAVP